MEFLPFISIFIIYFLVAFIKPYIQPKFSFNICAICISVSFTWLLMLVLKFFGIDVSTVALAVLMGMSVTGIMYKLESLYKEKRIKNFWFVRLVIVIGGLYSIDSLLDENWNLFLFIVAFGIIIGSVATFLFQGVTHESVVSEQTKAGKKKSLIKRLDDCC